MKAQLVGGMTLEVDVLEPLLVTATSATGEEQLFVTVRISTTVTCGRWSMFPVSVSFGSRDSDITVDCEEENIAASEELVAEVPSDHNASDVSVVVESATAARALQVIVEKAENDVSVADS